MKRFSTAALVAILLLAEPAAKTLPPAPVLAWDPNTEADLAGYRLYYGPLSGQYTTAAQDVGLVTSVPLPPMTPGSTLYFVLTAYTWGGMESPPSEEISYTMPVKPRRPNATAISMPTTVTVIPVETTSDAAAEVADDPSGDLNSWIGPLGVATGVILMHVVEPLTRAMVPGQ